MLICKKILVVGEIGYVIFVFGVEVMYLFGYILEYDFYIVKKFVYVIVGGKVLYGIEVDE